MSELTGFQDAQRPEQKARLAKIPKDKAAIVRSYLSINKHKTLLSKQGKELPTSLLDEIKCYDRIIYQRFSPQERQLLKAQVQNITKEQL